MEDNATPHHAVVVAELLGNKDIQRLDWPTSSPDPNPIEQVWDFLGRPLAAREQVSAMIPQLQLVLQEEWHSMHQQLLDNIVLNMGRNYKSGITVRSNHVLY